MAVNVGRLNTLMYSVHEILFSEKPLILQTTLSDAPFPEVMEHGLYSLPFDQAEIIEEIQSSEDSSSELGAMPGKQVKKKQK